MPTRKKTRPPEPAVLDGPLLIRIHIESNGVTYSLDLWSKDRAEAVSPGAARIPLVFFGFNKEADWESLHRPFWPVAATLLTGLTMDQIGQLGGVRIEDPRQKRLVWEWRPELATVG
jgi:hypothetical protein